MQFFIDNIKNYNVMFTNSSKSLLWNNLLHNIQIISQISIYYFICFFDNWLLRFCLYLNVFDNYFKYIVFIYLSYALTYIHYINKYWRIIYYYKHFYKLFSSLKVPIYQENIGKIWSIPSTYICILNCVLFFVTILLYSIDITF